MTDTLLGMRGIKPLVEDPKHTTVSSMVELELYDCEVEEIARAIEHNHYVRTYHKDHSGDGPLKAAERLRVYLKLRVYADRCELIFDDWYCIIDDKYTYAMATGNWRVDGRKTWYRSKSPEHFIENYILKSPFDKE